MTAPLTWAEQRAIEAASRKAWLRSLAYSGQTVTKASKAAGISRTQLSNMMSLCDIKFDDLSKDMLTAHKAMVASGMTAREIAAATNREVGTVRQYLLSHRLSARPDWRGPKPAIPRATAPQKPAAPTATTWLTRPKGSQNAARASQ